MMSLSFLVGGMGGAVLQNLADPARYALVKSAWALTPLQNLPLENLITLFNRGLITKERFVECANEYGFECEDWDRFKYQIFKRAAPNRPIDLDTEAYQSEAYLFSKFLQTDKLVLSPSEVLLMLNRELMSMQAARWMLTGHFKGERGITDKFLDLRYEIPPLTDLIQFAVKEAFDPDTITRMGYNKELPVDIVPWMRKLGYGGKSGMPIPAGATTNKGPEVRTQAEWLDHYWYAHWTNLSPTQWFDALHRFYADSPHGPSPEFRADINTTTQDVEAGLKVADYPEPLRKRLLALSYSPLTRVDVRRMHQIGVLNREQVYHSFRAIGYDDRNAESLTSFVETENARKQFGSTRNKVLVAAEKQVRLGMIGLDSFVQIVGRVNVPRIDAIARYDIIVSDTQSNKAKTMIGKIRRWFFSGQLSIDNARQALMSLELMEGTVQELIKDWTLERAMGRKFIAAGKLVELFKKKLIKEVELETKLFNLGYEAREISLIIEEAKLDIESHRQKEQAKQEKELARTTDKTKAALKAAKEKEDREARKKEKESLRDKERKLNKGLAAFTEKNIVAWFKDELIDEETVQTILELKGWTQLAIEAFKRSNLDIEPPDEEE